ncbi:MAG TPA: NTP transferase domain-containing protein [Bryobacteraceae bacterium]|nr:NTP transferase domain-containing protein [Bryobacteraceae bacterium]
MNVLTAENWEQYAAPAIDPAQWTAIIPAAGKGSRLGFERPKILFPVGGRMIVEWLLDFLLPNCTSIVFVLSPHGRPAVEEELRRLIPGRYRIAIQEVPTGMGDAVELGLDGVYTRHVAIVWGDQVALRRSSVDACLRVHAGPLAPDLTCPTVMRSAPYIHVERDAEGRISGLLQKREGDRMPAEGESDTGFFCFRTARLKELLARLRATSGRGHATGEFNFLPIIPLAAREGVVVTPRIMTLEETIGINSKEDAALLEPLLLKRRPIELA